MSSKHLSGDIVEAIKAGHGAGAAQLLSSPDLSIHIPGVISTGSEWVDWALGRGGVPLGRITLIGGNEGTGKTTMALTLAANVQKMGGIAVYVDAEYKLDSDYAQDLGVDTDTLVLSQPEHMEQALSIINTSVKMIAESRKETGKATPALIVLDSLNALPTKKELEGAFEDKHIGEQARMMGQGLKKLVRMLSAESVALVLISQLRVKIGVMFGDDLSTACGKAPKFYATSIIRLTQGAAVIEDGNKTANNVHVKIVKNQVAAPFKKAQMLIRYGQGIDYAHSIQEGLKASGNAQTKGAWTTCGEDKWMGLKQLGPKLESDEELKTRLVDAIRLPYGWD